MSNRELGTAALTSAGILFFVCGVFAAGSRAQCLGWDGRFDFAQPLNDKVFATAVFDDGSGPSLFAGGSFSAAGGTTLIGVAKWNGSEWSALGTGLTYLGGPATVYALRVYDDGTGPALYVAGGFTTAGGAPALGIARWNGSAWSNLGSGLDGNGVAYCLAVFDDGTGAALYAGGTIHVAGGQTADSIAKWNGSTWAPVGTGTNGSVYTLSTFDDGTGPALYAGGSFSLAGGAAASNIAKWDGSSWSALGAGLNNTVNSLGVFDGGSGPTLIAGGLFSSSLGVTLAHVAKWNGSTWAPVGIGTNGTVASLFTFDDGTGSALYAGGTFSHAGGVPAKRIAKWNGTLWSALGPGLNTTVYTLSAFDVGRGAMLIAGGAFTESLGVAVTYVGKWDGSSWSGIAAQQGDGANATVRALTVHDDGSGPALYAGGDFSTAGELLVDHVAKWDGSQWSALGTLYSVNALVPFDNGSGSKLYAAQTLSFTGSVSVLSGTSWNSIGSCSQPAFALCVADLGSGPALYAGGNFGSVNGVVVNGIARWNGVSQWSALGQGIGGVNALAVFDDGTGTALYAGGSFSVAGQSFANYIANWNGSSWSTLGSGLDDHVYALAVFDDGGGSALYVGGAFTRAGGTSANRIARWNGSTWSAVGSGFDDGVVFALAVFDDGGGPALFAGGGLATSDGETVSGIAKWTGTSWHALGAGVSSGANPMVRALAAFDDGRGSGPNLFVGGSFEKAGAQSSVNIAEWLRCASPVDTFCFGDGSDAQCPCGNQGLLHHGCDNSIGSGGARLVWSGTTNPDTLVLHSSGELPNALSIFLQGDALVSGTARFGDGLRCAAGHLKRLYAKNASLGQVVAPEPGDPSITARSAALGDPIAPGSTRYYQTYYRDPNLGFCPPPQGDGWNVTNGVKVVW